VVVKTRTVRRAAGMALLVAALGPVASAQPPAGPVQTERGQGLQVKFLATPWRPDVFAAFEEGRSPAPPSWAFARLELSGWFALDGHRLAPGRYAMVLAPKAGTLPMSLELRRVDGREFFVDPAALTPPPPGETVYKAPVTFGPSPEPAPVLDLTLASYGSDGAVLTIRYGDRRLVEELARTEP
jgi:hypothetical protein